MATFPLLITPIDLLPHLDQLNLRIIDLSRESVFQQVHLRGAIWLNGRRLMRGIEPVAAGLPDLDVLTALMAELGITPQHQVVAYDDEGGGWASRLIWTLHRLGHDKVSLLDGGIHAWLADGLPTEEGASSTIDCPLSIWTLDPQPEVSAEQLMVGFEQDPYHLWDCRSLEEYRGERLAARRGGHIPNAKHYEWTRAMDRSNALRLRPLDQIRQELIECGILSDAQQTPHTPIVTYCQSHHRSSLTYVVGKILGLPIQAYAGGWSDWGNRTDTPIHTGEPA
ncbi:MAG: rhodanese-like domain-containing protein [Pseudomonadota bacterium]|nr:rhodanese-like domain-containing protein [Pseudomonadota bacterium]